MCHRSSSAMQQPAVATLCHWYGNCSIGGRFIRISYSTQHTIYITCSKELVRYGVSLKIRRGLTFF